VIPLLATRFFLAFSCLLLLGAPVFAAGVDFDARVAPILIQHCLECHTGPEPSGKLNLSTGEGLRRGGKSGAVVGGDQILWERVHAGEMPPKKQGKSQALSKGDQETLKAWLDAGAEWPKGRTLDLYEITTATRGGRNWWSFQPIKAHHSETGIDGFIRKDLAKAGWVPAPAADRRTLIRRVSYDLIGLPPTAAEIDAFVADPDPDAYAKLVDRLLASPHYGERWARHWLDVARYAETSGYERDQTKPNAWKYRDWVVAAFNDDKPFERFILEQLAGDELPDRSESTVTATGFLRLGTWNDEPNDPNEYKYERLEDMVHATTSGFLALTVKCARCHDHKFDPIPQRDYYRLASAFWAGPIDSGDRGLLGGPSKEQLGYDVFGWTDRGPEPPPLKLLKKGDPTRPLDVVPFGHLSLVANLPQDAVVQKTAKTSGRRLAMAKWIADPKNPLTARVWVNRLWQHHFGRGLVRSPDNFGFTGEKPTHPELLDFLATEFLKSGGRSKPLHRMMVLSATYRQSSIHPRQVEYAAADAGNRLWWHAERRRLDAESLRDSLLFAAGRLDLSRRGGPSFVPEISPEALEGWSQKGTGWKPSPPAEQNRRTLYVFMKRGLLPPMLTVFDSPETTLPCGQRDVTTVAPQALAMLNNSFVHQQSRTLAARAAKEPDFVTAAWRFALGRGPTAEERAAAAEHITAQKTRLGSKEKARESLCHVLLNLNEFVYVD
jgi:Protein of unknown function (DUF1549)/Protein of unknown function (DUF1553)/Planctomycete cytochrome C